MGKEGRVFLRGMSSEQYGLAEFRNEQLAAPRVRNDDFVADDAKVGHSGDSQDSRTWWRIGPGDDPFLTQNIQVHFVEIPAGKSNHGHGHQNEAVFYILQGSGYEIHDDEKYPWEQGDLVVVHVDSVHRHFNDGDETAWETTRDGKIRVLCSKDTPNVRVVSVDMYEQEIPPGSRSAKHLHMADEGAYVLSGQGQSIQWGVEAESAGR